MQKWYKNPVSDPRQGTGSEYGFIWWCNTFQIFNGPIANTLGPFQMFVSTFGLNILRMMDSGYVASILNIQKRI